MALNKDILNKLERIEKVQVGVMVWNYVLSDPRFGMFVCEHDPHKEKFTKVGASCKRLLGWEVNEMVGKKFDDFLHPDDMLVTKQKSKNIALEKSVASGFVNRYRKKDGGYVIMTWYSGGFDRDVQFAFAEVREMTEICQVCNDPVIKKIRVNLDPGLKRVGDPDDE